MSIIFVTFVLFFLIIIILVMLLLQEYKYIPKMVILWCTVALFTFLPGQKCQYVECKVYTEETNIGTRQIVVINQEVYNINKAFGVMVNTDKFRIFYAEPIRCYNISFDYQDKSTYGNRLLVVEK